MCLRAGRFDGALPRGGIDNRPFLRCMHAFGLGLWRLARFDEGMCIFDRMLWLNPSDNQGVRLLSRMFRPRFHGRRPKRVKAMAIATHPLPRLIWQGQ